MIRLANSNDLKDINKLINDYFCKNKSYNMNTPFISFIINDDKFINALLCYSLIYERIEINYIVVDKKYENQGIGTELLNYLDKIAKDNNVLNITLEVSETNKRAIYLYEKQGFKKVTIRKNYYKEINGILMMKELGD